MNMSVRGELLACATALGLGIGLISSCTTTGTGTGTARGSALAAQFTWQSKDDRSGTMEAALSDGAHYGGQYFQITSDTRVEQIGPLWSGWHRGWRGWRDWDSEPNNAFVTHYSGRVMANLAGVDGQHMRCNFRLVHPSSGMAGGGQGQCQLPSGQTIDATFPHG